MRTMVPVAGPRAHVLGIFLGCDYMMDQMVQSIRSLDAIAIPSEGGVIVLDPSARRALRVPQLDPIEESGALNRVRDFLGGEAGGGHRSIVQLDVLVEALDTREGREAVMRTVQALAPRCSLRIKVHRASISSSWQSLLGLLNAIRALPLRRRLPIYVVTHPDSLEERPTQALFDLGIFVQVIHGWWPGCSAQDYRRIHGECLRDLAEFGLLAHALWYVHDGNVGEMGALLEKTLRANYYSGFSAPLQIQSPYATLEDAPILARQGEYSSMLAEIYESHPHYDDTFEPLFELAEHCHDGGWNSRDRIPHRLRILFRGNGRVDCFRQIPLLSRRWMNYESVASLDDDDLVESLVEFHRDEYRWESIDYCNGCGWRFLCGGLDPSPGGATFSEAKRIQDLVCSYRMLFLEAFTLQRLNAGVIPIVEL